MCFSKNQRKVNVFFVKNKIFLTFFVNYSFFINFAVVMRKIPSFIVWLVSIVVLLSVFGGSMYLTDILVSSLAREEHKRMEIWAEATRQLLLADEKTDISFVSMIVEKNTTIPVYMTDTCGQLLLYRNVRLPKKNAQLYLQNKLAELKQKVEPIEVSIDGRVVQYIYYDESIILKRLHYFPMVQIMVLVVLAILMLYSFYVWQRSEENRLWVGLSKETAHQLGTPISSLIAWHELLQNRYEQDDLLPQMKQDIDRLQTVAERFSKVGSMPVLKETVLYKVLNDSVEYMSHRCSRKILYNTEWLIQENREVWLDKPLFSWVVENVCKNSVDAMEGSGKINVRVTENDSFVFVDISDTGKGLPRHQFKTIFRPGYTTKKRGWGLGLSLAKRIMRYHNGDIFVKQSTVGEGTCFRIQLKRVDSIQHSLI